MNELSNGLEEFAAAAEDGVIADDRLRKAAALWAKFVVENNTGTALDLGLAVAKSIADYLNYFESQK